MANVTAKAQIAKTPWGDSRLKRGITPVSATWYIGALVAVDSNGFAVKCDDTSGIQFDGIISGFSSQAGRMDTLSTDAAPSTPLASGDQYLEVDRPWRFTIPIAAAVATDVGRKVYAAFDGTAAYSTSNSILLGFVDEVLSSTVISVNPVYAPLSPVAVTNNTITFAGTTGNNTIVMPDNLAAGLVIKEGSNAYMTFDTANSGGEYVQFDKKALFPDNVKCEFGTGEDITVLWDGTDLLVAQLTADSIVKWGVSGAGINHVFYGDTATYNLTWDQSNDQLLFNDNAKLAIGTGAGSAGDITFLWDATKLVVGQLTTNSAIDWGVDGAGLDQNWYGDTASAKAMWDQSADALILSGAAKVKGLRVATGGATAITTTRAVTSADSGGVFTVGQGSAYTVTIATPLEAGERYLFQLVSAGANDVSIVATACTFEGTITIDSATIPATGSTLKFASGASVLGDNIEVVSTSTSKFLVRAIASGAGGITIT